MVSWRIGAPQREKVTARVRVKMNWSKIQFTEKIVCCLLFCYHSVASLGPVWKARKFIVMSLNELNLILG